MKNLLKLYTTLFMLLFGIIQANAQIDIDTIDINDQDAIKEIIEEQLDNAVENIPAAPAKPIPQVIKQEKPVNVDSIKDELVEGLEDDSLENVDETFQIPDYPPLGIFGHDFYRNNNFSFYRVVDDAVVADDYIVGKGDQLTVTVWNQDNVISDKFEVDNTGSISKELLGKIYLEGLTFARAKEIIRSRYARAYTFQPGNFDIVMSGVRIVSVDITGDVTVPGTYTFPAANTVINVLKLAGGPNKNGSSRKIYIKRAGKVLHTFDTYEFLLDPNFSTPLYLMDKDVIHIGPIGKLVGIVGAIRKEDNYELKDNETFADVLEFTGGFKPNASRNVISIYRYDNGAYILKSVPFKENSRIPLKDGDKIRIGAIEAIVLNEVSVMGAVNQPGEYEFRPGMRVSDLIKDGSGLRYDAIKNRAYITRLNDELIPINISVDLDAAVNGNGGVKDILLKPKDKVQVLSQLSFNDAYSIEIQGAVNSPGVFQYVEGIRLAEIIDKASGLRDDAIKSRAYITRLDDLLTAVSIPVDLEAVISGRGGDGDILLKPKDEILILSQLDFNENFSVALEGAVNQPGIFPYIQGMNVAELIDKAAGLRYDAIKNRAYIVRENEDFTPVNIPFNLEEVISGSAPENNIEIYPNDKIIVLSKLDYTEQFSVDIYGEVNKPGQYVFSDNFTLRDLIIVAGGFKSGAKTTEIELRRVMTHDDAENRAIPIRSLSQRFNIGYDYLTSSSGDEIKLLPWDQIFVRTVSDYELPRTITVNGEVEYPGVYPLSNKNMKISDLLGDAGGLTTYASASSAKFYRSEDAKGMVVIDLNEVQRNIGSRYNYVLKQGDRLEVPTIDNIVSIEGAIRNVIDDKQLINTAFQGRKNAKWYIDEYGAGFDKRADRKSTQVLDPNGKLNGTRKFLFFNIYPEVKPGSEINVEYKPAKKEKGESTFFAGFNLNTAIAVVTSLTTTALVIIAATK